MSYKHLISVSQKMLAPSMRILGRGENKAPLLGASRAPTP